MNDEDAKVIAFYLPQFYPIAENDAWWGAGFTEWTKVVTARPLGPDHYQPHIPGELGFYDLRVPEVRERQAAMARRHGIHGFMYYHYWFGGERILDRTFEEVLGSGRPEFPFALCWANENWTRIWDAGEKAILLEQRYDTAEQATHIEWLVGAFKDPRYITVAGRPLFAIYRIQSLADGEGFLHELRSACVAAGLADPYIVKFDTHDSFEDPMTLGCDAAAQFLPHGLSKHVGWGPAPPGAEPTNHYLAYDDVVDVFSALPAPAWTRHECVFPGWDNSPRRRQQWAIVVFGNTPERYEEWLHTVYGRAPERGGIVFVNAWNEWAEGAHLEPDAHWGDGFLRATARVILGAEPAPPDDQDLAGEERVHSSFADLYLDVYERYVRARHRLTSVEDSIRREVERRTRRLEQQLRESETCNALLADRIEALLIARHDGDA